MKTRLTPYYLELVYDACLKSFWRRKSLAKFLHRCGIAESFLSSWLPQESKRELLDRLFEKLPQSDRGRRALLQMSQYLMEQKSFPDLDNWEDSAHKIKIAHDAVSRLRVYHSNQQEEIQSEEEKAEARRGFLKRQEEISKSQQSLQKLNDRLNELGTRLSRQDAGYDFERWFYDLTDFCELTSRRPYVTGGRQIDGALTVSGTTYLMELKFTVGQATAEDVDTFFKKVTTNKADNTMGIMVSISGYSSVAIKEASSDRTPLLLLDHSHLYLVLSGIMGLGEVIERVRRHASQTGEAYLTAADFSG